MKILPFSLFVMLLGSQTATRRDVVIACGRVMDPESGLDAVRNIGIRDGKVAAISEQPLTGNTVLQVVAAS